MHFLTYLHSTFIKPFVLYIYFSDDKSFLVADDQNHYFDY